MTNVYQRATPAAAAATWTWRAIFTAATTVLLVWKQHLCGFLDASLQHSVCRREALQPCSCTGLGNDLCISPELRVSYKNGLEMHLSWDHVQARQWACRACGTGRDAAGVEALLVREVACQARAYQLQDLKCLKCRQVWDAPADILHHDVHGCSVASRAAGLQHQD